MTLGLGTEGRGDFGTGRRGDWETLGEELGELYLAPDT